MALKLKTSSRHSIGKVEAMKEVNKIKSKRLNANIQEDVYLKLKIKAMKENKTINELVLSWVDSYLAKD